MQKPKFEVGDKVKRLKEFQSRFWTEATAGNPDMAVTINYTDGINHCELEELHGRWLLGAFEDVHSEITTDSPKTPSDYLRQAADTLDERGKQYDSSGSERSMEKTVTIFNMLTDNSLTTAEGWQFMKILKDVRLWSNTDVAHVDSIVDNLGYTALLAEETISLGGKLKETN